MSFSWAVKLHFPALCIGAGLWADLTNEEEVAVLFHHQTRAAKEQMSLPHVLPLPSSTFQGDLEARVWRWCSKSIEVWIPESLLGRKTAWLKTPAWNFEQRMNVYCNKLVGFGRFRAVSIIYPGGYIFGPTSYPPYLTLGHKNLFVFFECFKHFIILWDASKYPPTCPINFNLN